MHVVRILMSGWLLLAAMCAQAGSEPDWSSWVLKIEVVRLDGVRELGSGVTIGPQRVITNCHVVRTGWAPSLLKVNVCAGAEAPSLRINLY